MSASLQDRQLAIVVGLCFVLGIVGSAIELNSGYVLDAETGRPLEGVYVVGRWNGDLFQLIKSHTQCLGVRAAKTDGLGRYTLLATSLDLNPLISDRYRTLVFYHAGYEVLQRPAQFSPWRTELKPDSRSGRERIVPIIRASFAMNCGQDSTSRSGVEYFKAVYDEVKRLAGPEDGKLVDSALSSVEDVELGFNEAANRQREREKKNTIFIYRNNK